MSEMWDRKTTTEWKQTEALLRIAEALERIVREIESGGRFGRGD